MNAYGKIAVVLAGLAIGAGIFTVSSLDQISRIGSQVDIRIDGQSIVAGTAETEAAREQGLGGRQSIGINQGMYFIFSGPGLYGFWMKNMNFPIDIVWISGHTVVGYVQNVPPPPAGTPDSALQVYYPPEPVDRVLELHAGRAALLRLSAGDQVSVAPLLPGGAAAAAGQ